MEGQFTYTYSQPQGYRFCQDSILFPRVVAGQIGSRVTASTRLLDVCAGCGVVGFELQYHLPQIQRMDFLEIQDEFAAHFEANREIANKPHSRFLSESYARLSNPEFASAYDFILGNPPYFMSDEGKLSGRSLNDRARFFIDENFETLIEGVIHALKPSGEAYLLVKSGEVHGRDSLREVRRLCGLNARAEFMAPIRQTQILKMIKC
jgi:tRNA1(Val) A37 N6-methylase TrmN6